MFSSVEGSFTYNERECEYESEWVNSIFSGLFTLSELRKRNRLFTFCTHYCESESDLAFAIAVCE